MVLMALDHASVIFNADRLAADSAALYVPGSELPLLDFMTRWVTPLCAPTFLVLAGAGIALGAAARRSRGDTSGIDRDLLIRGSILILLDVLYMTALNGQGLLLQVLYAIGLSMILMIPLRRLPSPVIAALGIGWFIVGERVTGLFWHPPAPPEALLTQLLLAPLHADYATILYPALPWAAMMMIGWAFGDWLGRRRASEAQAPIGALLGLGAGCLALFALIRGLNGYGNMFLPREDGSLAQWLHVSKYPPSASFASLELGLLFVILAALMWIEARVRVRADGPLLVFGQTALFFYLLHFLLLGIIALALGMFGNAGLAEAYAATAVVLLIMLPLCRRYRRAKRARPDRWIRYI